MKAKLATRWSSVGRASVAVAGVCLTGSVASAWTTTRAADFETEFEAGQALGTAPATLGETSALNGSARILAAETGSTVWEQTLVGYLDRLVAKDCDEANTEGAKASEGVAEAPTAGIDAGLQDAEQSTEVAAVVTPAIDSSKADANPDWDIDEPAAAVAGVDPDWDLEEPAVAVAEATADGAAVAVDADWDLEDGPVAVAEVNPDWDIEEPAAVAVAVAADDADWDIAESPAVATAANPDWDLDEPAPGEAVAATARESAEAPSEPVADQNPDWDIDEPTVAAASADEVTTVDPADGDFDLLP